MARRARPTVQETVAVTRHRKVWMATAEAARFPFGRNPRVLPRGGGNHPTSERPPRPSPTVCNSDANVKPLKRKVPSPPLGPAYPEKRTGAMEVGIPDTCSTGLSPLIVEVSRSSPVGISGIGEKTSKKTNPAARPPARPTATAAPATRRTDRNRLGGRNSRSGQQLSRTGNASPPSSGAEAGSAPQAGRKRNGPP